MRAVLTYLSGLRKGDIDAFADERITVGRAPDNRLVFSDSERRVSAHHAEIRRNGSQYVIRDLGSTNGTMINGRRVVISELHHDDLIEFGAGGPVARFAIESDLDITPTEEVMIPDDMKATFDTSPLILREKPPAPARSNTWLILSVVASMLIGAIAGVVLSARLSTTRTSFSAVAERNSPAVVFIRTEFAIVDASGQTMATDARSGSGFVISSSGLIVTNRHLIQDWEYTAPPAGMSGRTLKIEVVFPGRRIGDAVTATLYKLSASKDIDVAILKINPLPGMPVVEGLDSGIEAITQGEEVAVIGYPLGLDLLEDRIETSLSMGVVGRVNQNFIQLNMRAYRGNSGGPALNSRGKVIGILTSNVASAEDITFCTPIEFASNMVRGEREIR